jgi:hypothetical protein
MKNPKDQIIAQDTEVVINEVIAEVAAEVDAETEAKALEPVVPKAERIAKLLLKLKASKLVKDDRAGKKIRRQLRKLGYYISKQIKPED